MSSVSELSAYRALAALNIGFAIAAKALDVFEELLLFGREDVEAYRIRAEELRADACHYISERLNHREDRQWAHFGRLQIERERRIIEAEKLEELRTKIKGKEEHQHGRRKTSRSPKRSKKESLGQKRRR